MSYLISKKYPMLYMNMPKAACSSIKNYMHFMDYDEWYPEPLAIHWSDKSPVKWNKANRQMRLAKGSGSLRFTFVRNPAKRVYSMYTEKLLSDNKYAFPGKRKTLTNHYNCDFVSPISIERERKNFIGLLNYIDDSIAKRTHVKHDHHWLPQSMIMDTNTTGYKLQFIGKVEDFKSDFNYVLKKVGYEKPLELRSFNTSKKIKHLKLEEILDENIIKIVNHIYHEDFVQFGYSFL